MNTISGLKVHSANNTLELIYADGSSATLSGDLLRRSCRCAECRREQPLLPMRVPAATILEIESIGLHGLRLHFSDGHARGIYPLPYLVELAELADQAPLSARATGSLAGHQDAGQSSRL